MFKLNLLHDVYCIDREETNNHSLTRTCYIFLSIGRLTLRAGNARTTSTTAWKGRARPCTTSVAGPPPQPRAQQIAPLPPSGSAGPKAPPLQALSVGPPPLGTMSLRFRIVFYVCYINSYTYQNLAFCQDP